MNGSRNDGNTLFDLRCELDIWSGVIAYGSENGIASSGLSVVSVPVKTMLIDVMGLPLYAGMAPVPERFCMVIAIRAALSARKRRPDDATDTSSTIEDVHTKLRAINKQKAERYLAERERDR